MSDRAHFVTPITPAAPTGRHVLLYVEEQEQKGMVVAGRRNAWVFDINREGWAVGVVDSWRTTDQLDNVLQQTVLSKGHTTIWVLRGWGDLVLSGLVELIDAGIITWRYISLSGRSTLVKGMWRNRPVTITSISNWTGNRWDSWGDVTKDKAVQRLLTAVRPEWFVGGGATDDQEFQAVAHMAAIYATSNMLALPKIAPTAAAAAQLTWRAWLGPRLVMGKGGKAIKDTPKGKQTVTYVAPLPSRPIKAANAERHTCYALSTRQLRQGLVDGQIYVADLSSAYLVALAATPLPLMYDKTLHKPAHKELVEKMLQRTGCALVRIQSDDWYYPCRMGKNVVPCKGRFWTWLAGADLVHALCKGHVTETWTAYLWHADVLTDNERELLTRIKRMCHHYHMPACLAGWRSIYSSLIGRFAGWQRVWEDSKAASTFGRWSQWMQADSKTGELVPHRSIAGRVQMLADKKDKLDSVPLMFGCVTAMVRWTIQTMAMHVGYDNVLAIAADSLWLTKDGWQSVLKAVSACGLPPDGMNVKAVYDRAWFSGKSAVVTERNGIRELHMPGVSKGAAIDADGKVIVEHTDDWDTVADPTSRKGIKRRKHRYSADSIVNKYGYKAEAILPGETVSIPLLSNSLLQTINGERTVEDA